MRTTPQQTHSEGVPQFRSAIVGAATGSSRSKYPASPIRVLIRRVPREPRAVLDSSRLQRLSSKTSIFARRWHLCPHLTISSNQLVWVDLPCFSARTQRWNLGTQDPIFPVAISTPELNCKSCIREDLWTPWSTTRRWVDFSRAQWIA